MQTENKFDIYVDGACESNGTPKAKAGWSYVVTKENSKDVIATKNGKIRPGEQYAERAELEALYQALLYCSDHKDSLFTIYTDSESSYKGITGMARRVCNRDIWEDIVNVCSELNNIDVIKIEGHKVDESVISIMNRMADKLARQASRSLINKK